MLELNKNRWNPLSITKKQLRIDMGLSPAQLSRFINHDCIMELKQTRYKKTDKILLKKTLDILFPTGIYPIAKDNI